MNGPSAGAAAGGPRIRRSWSSGSQALSEEVERLDDPRARALAQELLGAVLELYGEGLERIVAAVDDAGERRRRRCASGSAQDGVVASLLLIHDLYPVPLEAAGRARRSRACGPTWSRTGATSSCSGSRTTSPGCASRGAATAARHPRRRWSWRSSRRWRRPRPTSPAIEVEGLDEPALAGLEVSGTELPVVQAGAANGAAPVQGPAWFELGRRARRPRPRARWPAIEVAGTDLIVAMVEGSLLAYLDSCPDCGSLAGRRAS